MRGCFDLPPFVLETVAMKKICKYHKRRGQEFTPNDVVRQFCPDAFYVAYPYALALLYGARNGEFKEGRVRLRCPSPQGILMEVERVHCRPWPLRLAKGVFDWVMARVLYPVDWENWHLRVRVVQGSEACPGRYTPGTSYWFNIGRLDELCPASFHGLYPFLLLAANGAALSWGTEASPLRLHCPDHQGMIYELRCLNPWPAPEGTHANE